MLNKQKEYQQFSDHIGGRATQESRKILAWGKPNRHGVHLDAQWCHFCYNYKCLAVFFQTYLNYDTKFVQSWTCQWVAYQWKLLLTLLCTVRQLCPIHSVPSWIEVVFKLRLFYVVYIAFRHRSNSIARTFRHDICIKQTVTWQSCIDDKNRYTFRLWPTKHPRSIRCKAAFDVTVLSSVKLLHWTASHHRLYLKIPVKRFGAILLIGKAMTKPTFGCVT